MNPMPQIRSVNSHQLEEIEILDPRFSSKTNLYAGKALKVLKIKNLDAFIQKLTISEQSDLSINHTFLGVRHLLIAQQVYLCINVHFFPLIPGLIDAVISSQSPELKKYALLSGYIFIKAAAFVSVSKYIFRGIQNTKLIPFFGNLDTLESPSIGEPLEFNLLNKICYLLLVPSACVYEACRIIAEQNPRQLNLFGLLMMTSTVGIHGYYASKLSGRIIGNMWKSIQLGTQPIAKKYLKEVVAHFYDPLKFNRISAISMQRLLTVYLLFPYLMQQYIQMIDKKTGLDNPLALSFHLLVGSTTLGFVAVRIGLPAFLSMKFLHRAGSANFDKYGRIVPTTSSKDAIWKVGSHLVAGVLLTQLSYSSFFDSKVLGFSHTLAGKAVSESISFLSAFLAFSHFCHLLDALRSYRPKYAEQFAKFSMR